MEDSAVTVYRLPDLAKSGTTTLAQAGTAHCFEIASYTSTQKPSTNEAETDPGSEGQKTKKDLLVVGCRKKVVVYGLGKAGYKDGLVSRSSRGCSLRPGIGTTSFASDDCHTLQLECSGCCASVVLAHDVCDFAYRQRLKAASFGH